MLQFPIPHINLGGPYTNRTIAAMFKCDDVSVASRKQTIYEEGGTTRGFNIYVYDGRLYVGGWHGAELNFEGAWLSTSITSHKWYHIALILRDGQDVFQPDKLEMWMNAKLIDRDSGGQLIRHGNLTGIGAVNGNTAFHDGIVEDTNVHHFKGVIDDVRLYDAALNQDDIRNLAGPLAVEPNNRFTTTWAAIKARR